MVTQPLIIGYVWHRYPTTYSLFLAGYEAYHRVTALIWDKAVKDAGIDFDPHSA
jgi:hypothetical protein